MEVVLKQSPNVLDGKKGSFILHCLDDEDLAAFRKGSQKFAKNILFIRKRKPKGMKKNEFFMTLGEWKEKLDQNLEMTRGAFVVLDEVKDSEEEYIQRMKMYKKYYPVVFVSYHPNTNDEDEDDRKEYLTSDMSGWRKKTSKNYGVTMYVNKSMSRFESFITSFSKLPVFSDGKDEIKPLVTTKFEIDDRGDTFVNEVLASSGEKGISAKKKKPVSVKKPKQTEADWSIFDGLPQPSMESDHTSQVWMKEFNVYLRDLISRFVPKGKEKLVDILVNKTTIKEHWLDVFTSIWYNPNPGENYESYEALGDSVIKYCFYVYLFERYGSVATPSQLNDTKTNHLSTDWQSILGEKMGLHEWVLAPKVLKNNKKIKEDLSEAFFGAIEEILNRKMRGLSTTLILNMLQKMFLDYEFKIGKGKDEKVAPGVSKLEQWYSQVAGRSGVKERIVVKKPLSLNPEEWDKLVEKFNKTAQKEGILIPVTEDDKEKGIKVVTRIDGGLQTTKIFLNEAGKTALERRGIPVHKLGESLLLSKASGKPSRQVTLNARSKAWDKLESLGVTTDFRQEKKKEKNTSGLENLEEALVIARESDPEITSVFPENAKQTGEHNVFQLFGERKDGKKVVLNTLVIDKSDLNRSKNPFQEVVDTFIRN